MTNGADAAPVAVPSRVPFDGQRDLPKSKEDFWDRLDEAISNLADVTVATLVTEVTVSVDDRGRLMNVTTPNTAIPAIITNVNLIQGDVTEIADTLKDEESLRTFHQGIVDKAVTVLPGNIKALAGLIEGFFGRGKSTT